VAFMVTNQLSACSIYKDTTLNYTLQTVEVQGTKRNVLRSSVPHQLFSSEQISRLNAVNIADVVSRFSGVTLKDYGGVGGQKTISVRGLGSLYTGVSYDGVMMSDVQSGQIDLGRFSLENIGEISLSNGQPDDIFQSARTFSSASVLSITTKLLPFDSTNLVGKASIRSGSFGLLNPSVFLGKNFAKKIAFNLLLDGMMAHGRYNFLQYYGTTDNKYEELSRQNSDVQSFRTELNSTYRVSDKQNISFKLNYFLSERGLPGGVVFYNNVISTQRLYDDALFAQMHYLNKSSNKLHFQAFARYNKTYNNFTETDSKYQGGYLDDKYLQNELYFSTSLKYNISSSFSFAAATDLFYNNLNINSNIYFNDFAFPTRYTGLGNIAAKYLTNHLSIAANLLYTQTHELVKVGNSSPNRTKFSPAISVSYNPFNNQAIRLRAYYKNIYRLPTFNDLYYQEIGNSNLRPEDANQWNLGVTIGKKNILFFSTLEFTADAYYNKITDKIIATPRDLFHWSMTNRGEVEVQGIDITINANKEWNKNAIHFLSNYSFQNAIDMTTGTDNYGELLPYSPKHKNSATLSYQHKWCEVGYNFQLTGIRWVGQMTNRYNKMDAYDIHSAFANIHLKRWELKTEINNILNTQYEVVKFYPMPRRNFRITLSINI